MIAEVLHSAAGELLAVRTPEGREVLVPFVRDIVPEVALADGTVTIDPPEGLLDLDATRPMKIDVVTIFPEYLSPLRTALLGKAIDRGLLGVTVHDLRGWTHDVHRSVDDAPYGGGPGMVMKPTVWGDALDAVCPTTRLLVVPTPAGVPFTQQSAQRWAGEEHLVFACGRYEGIDQRVFDDAARRVRVEEVSIGDYVLIGGEVAVLVMVEAVRGCFPACSATRRPTKRIRSLRCRGRRPAGGPELHPAGQLARARRARDPALRRPREGRGVAARAGRCTAPRNAAQTCWLDLRVGVRE